MLPLLDSEVNEKKVGGDARSVFLSGLIVRADDEVNSSVNSGEYAGEKNVCSP